MISANRRVAKEFARAQRHTSRVRVLKRTLPAAGIFAILAIVASLFLSGAELPSVNLGSARIEDGKLVMDAARLTGTDDSNRPYDLKAERAIQDAETPSRIALEGISAKLPMEDTVFAHVTAGNGLYDAEAKTLSLGGVVAVDTDNGMSIRMNDADIDIDSGNLRTTSPVEVDTGRANVKSESLIVENNGKTIIFENRVRMVIQPLGDSSESGAQTDPVSDSPLRQARSILDSRPLTSE